MRMTLAATLVLFASTACKTDDLQKPMPRSRFNVPERTIQNTWVPSAKEQELTQRFLTRFSEADADWYREMLLRSDARIQTPRDPIAQRLLDEIYAERWKTNEEATETERGK